MWRQELLDVQGQLLLHKKIKVYAVCEPVWKKKTKINKFLKWRALPDWGEIFSILLEGRLFLNSLKLFVCSFVIAKIVYKDYNFNDFVSQNTKSHFLSIFTL